MCGAICIRRFFKVEYVEWWILAKENLESFRFLLVIDKIGLWKWGRHLEVNKMDSRGAYIDYSHVKLIDTPKGCVFKDV